LHKLSTSSKFYHRNFSKTVLATVLFLSTYYLLLPALPLYMQTLGTNKFEIGLIMGIFSISSLILRPISGQLVDVYGRKKVMLISILIYLVTPLFYFWGTSIAVLAFIQIFYGFAMGSYTTSSTTYVADIAPAHMVASVVGWFSIAIILAKGIAPAVGTRFYQSAGFMLLVWFSVLIAVIALFITRRIEEPTLAKDPANQSIPYLKVITDKKILLPTLTLFCGLITFGAISVMLPLFAHSRGIINIENFFVLHTLTVVFTRVFTGKLGQKHLSTLVIISMLLLILSLALMSIVNTMGQLLTVAVIYGLGYGAFYPVLSALVVIHTPIHQRGTTLGFFTTAFDLGVSAGTVLGGLSEFVGFRAVYLGTSLIPLAGLLLFILVYLPHLRALGAKSSSV
jgi:MFS family permease